MNRLFNSQNRNKLLNYLRPWTYLGHPGLKLGNPQQKWKMLMTMKDLRMWITENAEHSSRLQKYVSEVEHLNREINYLQFRAFLFPYLMFIGVVLAYLTIAPQFLKGGRGSFDRPITGGMSIVHDGSVPKITNIDTNDILGL